MSTARIDPQIENEEGKFLLTELDYIVELTKVVSALKQGADITQMANGDVIISQTKVVHVLYKWSDEKKWLVKSEQYDKH